MSEPGEIKVPQADVATTRPGFFASKWNLFAVVSVLSLIADQATKIWARGSLPVNPAGCTIPDDIVARRCGGVAKTVIDGFWEWRLSMNPGSAFGLFSSQTGARILLSVVGIAAVIGMIYMLRKSRPDQRILHWALALVAGGAVGNLIDRMYYGVVTDFVLWRYKTHEWPVFNVADVVLVVGVGLMFIDIQKENKREKGTKQDKKAKAAAKANAAAKAKAQGLVKDLRD
ncbi:MAG: lipoprotein signal peptidase [Myxococcales bacterium]|nr:lipoprotein signal peptidase [Myxococcales bacterium]